MQLASVSKLLTCSGLNRADERLRDHILNLDSVRAIRRKFRVERFNTCSIIWQDVWGARWKC